MSLLTIPVPRPSGRDLPGRMNRLGVASTAIPVLDRFGFDLQDGSQPWAVRGPLALEDRGGCGACD